MDPQLAVAIVVSIALVTLMITLASRAGRNRAQSIARVEALRALVDETTGMTQTTETTRTADDWDTRLRVAAVEAYDDTLEYDDVQDFATAQNDDAEQDFVDERDLVEAPRPAAARASRAVATTPQFVVHVPDKSGARPYQVSFQHKESQP